MAVGKAVLEELLQRDLVGNSKRMGEKIMARLNGLRSQLNIERVRGSGLLIGFDLRNMEGTTLVNRCLEQGVLINSPGQRTIRLMPPLIVSEKEVEQFLAVLSTCVAA